MLSKIILDRKRIVPVLDADRSIQHSSQAKTNTIVAVMMQNTCLTNRYGVLYVYYSAVSIEKKLLSLVYL